MSDVNKPTAEGYQRTKSDIFFDYAFKKLLSHEGGYIYDPDDAGGETKYGISKRSYPDVDIEALTVDDAKEIYRQDFWDNQRYKDIKTIDIAAKIFDMAVNMGPRQAHRLTQQALNAIGQQVKLDSILGPKTLEAINKANPVELLPALRDQSAEFYYIIATNCPKQNKFLKGWLSRAYA